MSEEDLLEFTDIPPEDEDISEDEQDDTNQEGENEDEEELPPSPLTKEHVKEGLSLLCKTGNGLQHAYVRLDVHDKQVTEVTILNCFVHIRYLDISENQLSDISPLNNLTHLLTLKADNNLLMSAELNELPFLQQASFAHNRIATTKGIRHPLLESLNLSFNKLTDASDLKSDELPNLHLLELRGNRLTSTSSVQVTSLKKLYLAANAIEKVEGLEQLSRLDSLHLRDNLVGQLDGFSESMAALQYLNIRSNTLNDMQEINKLKSLPLLRALVLEGNPVFENSDYRIEVLVAVRRLERLDKDEFTDEERGEAEELYEQRKAHEEQTANQQETEEGET
ncbi:leucine-rich repeat-containing protein 23-like [Corticium candelabrum]|uniref:leucine-rich repeat-containing protein 23-like n=1 Tax=Corticium candelabrum TaxID=121492 RepID=UPI002E2762C3|nr:leucine-rich repeat-containing protein 23-like [Corticium candelabrum]